MFRMELLNKPRSGDVLRSIMALLADTFGSGEVFRKFDGRSGCLGNVDDDGTLEQESAAEQSLLHVPIKIFTTFESKLTFDISGILTERGLPRTSQMGLPQQSVTTMMLRKTRT
jgi:hypothetical protein